MLSIPSIWDILCFILPCQLRLFLVAFVYSHWSHLKKHKGPAGVSNAALLMISASEISESQFKILQFFVARCDGTHGKTRVSKFSLNILQFCCHFSEKVKSN